MQLETQLFEVIEQEKEGVVFSSSTLDDAKLSNRARRGIRRRRSMVRSVEEPVVRVGTVLTQSFIHPVREFDRRLVDHVQTQIVSSVEVPAVRDVLRSSAVPVRFSVHEPSDHVVSLQLPARPMVEQVRQPFGKTVEGWTAPYEIPPSIEGLVAATQDLWIEKIDPRFFLEQFTAAEAEVAYEHSYRLWAKVLAPFIVWEEVGSNAPLNQENAQVQEGRSLFKEVPTIVQVLEETGEMEGVSLAPESVAVSAPTPVFTVQETFLSGDQFTSADVEQAYRASYGLWARLKRVGRQILSLFDRGAEDVREEVREVVEVVQEEVHEVVEGVEEVWGVPKLVPRLHTMRIMVGFLGLLMIVTIPAGAVSLSRSFGSSVREVKSQSQAALVDVQTALSGSPAEQVEAWAAASGRFSGARESLVRTNALALGLAQALPTTRAQYGSVRALLLAGERTAQAAKLLTLGLSRALDDRESLRPDERIGTFTTYLDYASPLLEEALSSLDEVQPDSLPADVREKVVELRGMVGDGRATLTEARELLSFVRDALGRESPRTYLLVFQNSSEIRPTGGFMGSVAEVVFDRGAIQSIHVPGGGPYDLRSQLRARVAPPRPLQLVGGRWEFQDANWFPDFPASAEKIRWFWNKAGQPTIDGVIAVNSSILQALLEVTGPIEMPEYGKTLSAENVILELQKSVELEYDKMENKPKKIIGDLFPKILERLKGRSREDWLRLVDVGIRALEMKDVQVWMAREEEERLVERYDWNGRLKTTIGDSLAIIEANIAGQKTDASIEEDVQHAVQVEEDGSIIDTVTLTRTHQAARGELFQGVNNVAYVRVYVPDGSELLAAEGFEVPSSTLFEVPLPEDGRDPDEMRLVESVSSSQAEVDVTREFGRTAFGGWIQLRPGQTRTTSFRYRLPFTVFDIADRAGESEVLSAQAGSSVTQRRMRAAYMLLLTSQSGKANRRIRTTVTFPSTWRLDWTNQGESSSLALDQVWDRDRVLAGLLYASF